MFTSCLRCDRPLGRNTELPHLPVGRRFAFDATTGRVWVVCVRCNQWNLTPIEMRWEAIAECEVAATAAESRGGTAALGYARTDDGVELLRVGGLPTVDVANLRYGKRIRGRQVALWYSAVALVAIAALLGVRAATEFQAAFGLYVAISVAALLVSARRRPPRLWLSIPDVQDFPRRLAAWRLTELAFERPAPAEKPVLLVPQGIGSGMKRLTGQRAAEFLARALPKLNGADFSPSAVAAALRLVEGAEENASHSAMLPERSSRRMRTRKRPRRELNVPLQPWELVVPRPALTPLLSMPIERRLALEMAATEQTELNALREEAESLTDVLEDEKEIGAIADDLLLPAEIHDTLSELKHRSQGAPNPDRTGDA